MSASRTLKLQLLADTDKFGKGLKNAHGQADGFGKKLGKVGKAAALGLAAAGAAAVAVGVKLWKAGEEAVTADARTRQIAESMGLFGDKAGDVAARLSTLAEKTALQTGMDQNSIKATQAKLLTFGELAKTAGEAGGAFDRANQAALDLAAAGFGTAEANAAQLGKALNDPIAGLASLSKSGVTFTDVEKDRIKTLVESNKMGEAQAIVLEAIETQVGGTAAATADGSARMGVAFSLVQESIGKKLVPMMDKLATFVTDKVLPTFERWTAEYGPLVSEWFQRVGEKVTQLAQFFQERVLPAAMSLWTWIRDVLIPGFRGFLAPIIESVRGVIEKLSSKVGENQGAMSKLWEIVKGLATFIFGTVLPIVGTMFAAKLDFLATVIGGVIDAVGWLVEKISKLVGWFGRVKSAVDRALAPLRKFLELAGKAGSVASGIGSKIGGAVKGLVPGLASGGIVTAPTLAMVGEGGEAEAVIPLSKLDAMLNAGPGVVINVTGSMMDPEGVARAVERALHDARRRTGGRVA